MLDVSQLPTVCTEQLYLAYVDAAKAAITLYPHNRGLRPDGKRIGPRGEHTNEMEELSPESHENSLVAVDISDAVAKQTSHLLGQHSAARSDVPCWTCRRRRVQCDRLLPTCKKCEHLERECLGYKKPLVWNKGVASRGKMMGKDFHDVKIQQRQSLKPSRKLRQPLPNNFVRVESGPGEYNEYNGPLSRTAMQDSYLNEQGFKVLVDPIFQDFTPTTRYYLDYCTLNTSAAGISSNIL